MHFLSSQFNPLHNATPQYLILFAFVLYCGSVATYRLFFSPLHSIPGPWYAAISDLWHLSHVLRLRRCRGIDELFKKYGPIVRVAPNMVAFMDVGAMKVVYGSNARLNKSSMYKSCMTNGHDHAFTTLDHAEHSVRRKAYAAHYTTSNLTAFQPELYDLTMRLVSTLDLVASTTLTTHAIDTLELLRYLLIDINFAHIFGRNPGMMPAWEDKFIRGGESNFLSDAVSDFPKQGLLKSSLPSWLWDLALKIPNARWQKLCASDTIIAKVATEILKNRRDELQGGKSVFDDDDKVSMLTRLLKYRYPSGEPIPDEDIISECTAHVIAGSDTSATTISYILWEISRRPDIALRLQSELDMFMPDGRKLPDIQVLQNLPYLNAVLKEGLRVYTAAPSPLERIAHGTGDKEFNLMGHSIPDGTIIGSQSWSTHRREDIFPCPELFLPDRWLLSGLPILQSMSQQLTSIPTIPRTPTKPSKVSGVSFSSCLTASGYESPSSVPASPISSVFSVSSSPGLSVIEKGLKGSGVLTTQNQMQAHFFPFGTGPRQCGGQNMAQIVIRIVIASIVRNFDVIASRETTEESMEICDSFVIFPKAMQCVLSFVPREH